MKGVNFQKNHKTQKMIKKWVAALVGVGNERGMTKSILLNENGCLSWSMRWVIASRVLQ